MRRVILALAALGVCTSPLRASAQEADITGWWVTPIEHAGEREPLYLHFENHDGHTRAHFTTPRVRIFEADIGPYAVSGTQVQLSGIGWVLTLNADRDAIDGTMPDGLFVEHAPVHFTRAAGPPQLPPGPAPQGPAPSPLWTVSVGAAVWAGLAEDPQRHVLFIADDSGRVTALNDRDGAQVWRGDIGAPIRATPTLDHGLLYVVSDAALVALDARNGRQVWSAPFGAELSPRLSIFDPNNTNWDHYSAAAAIDRGVAVVAGRDGCVYALDAHTGARRWQTCTGHLITSTPAVTRDAIYFGSFDGKAHALARSDGHELWSYDTHWPIPRDAVVSDGNVLFGSRSYDFVALDAHTGRPVWNRFFWFSWVDSVPNVRDGKIYIGSSDALVVQAFDAASGRTLWSSPVGGWGWARVAVGRGLVYSALVGGRYTAPREGGLAALDRRTGAMRWMLRSQPPQNPRELHGFAAAPVVSGGRVFAADLAGHVYAFADSAR